MRRLSLVSCILLLALLAFPAYCLAWTHGQFTATTDACAGCHVAHAGQAAKLLKVGPPEAALCFLCHGDGGTSAPYDVEDGYTVGAAVYPSTAGGFVYEFKDLNANYAIDPGELIPVTSRHNVWGVVYESGPLVLDPAAVTLAIPGGSNAFTGTGFTCTSCHDPHGGGATPDPATGLITGSATTPNPRLLRKTITVGTATYSDLYVSFKFETVGTFTYGTPSVASGVYRVIQYVDGSTNWCGACHVKFQTDDPDTVPGAGHAVFYYGMWRHPVNVHVIPPPATSTATFDGSIATGTPLEIKPTGSNISGLQYVRNLGCLTCHRAHSTTATMAGWASSWPRSEGGTSSSSALLRMDNRGVCFNCHRSGEYNCWQDTRIDCSKCHPGAHVVTVDCTLCHL
ncbi:putative CXXCH cytochrome family protein [Thermodesulfitimonas autotrophica]|uniref:Putative CXXCH cytochrome family protein n=1 Tax=Thermodesulfitimonas autotrophica TaxID=1894989 RepID=A0A3N5AWZ4_9THEO|nr:cytochrome c3 family protein [Thermodesulfitimonas autotrophica]RPF49539.1 putative CXXCH cytochrome family protein [Thermodesulfitimonas autotrophica]